MKYLLILLFAIAAAALFFACNGDNGVTTQPDTTPHAMDAPVQGASVDNDPSVDQTAESDDEVVPETAPSTQSQAVETAPLSDGTDAPVPESQASTGGDLPPE